MKIQNSAKCVLPPVCSNDPRPGFGLLLQTYSGCTSIKMGALRGKSKILEGQKREKCKCYFCHCYAEIVKFGLILALFFGGGKKLGGMQENSGGKIPFPIIPVAPPLDKVDRVLNLTIFLLFNKFTQMLREKII